MQDTAPQPQEGTAPPEGGAGGLPQFDLAMWPGQMAWFLIFFAIVFVLMVRVFVPRIGGAIEARDAKMAADVAEAWRMKDEAESQAKAAAEETAQARASAQRLAAEARAKAQADAAARLAAEEAKLAETSAAAEARIAGARETAMANVGTIAKDAAGAIVQKLTGKAATATELASAARG
jgi:F-type H+-transporting ATPase subunit b